MCSKTKDDQILGVFFLTHKSPPLEIDNTKDPPETRREVNTKGSGDHAGSTEKEKLSIYLFVQAGVLHG